MKTVIYYLICGLLLISCGSAPYTVKNIIVNEATPQTEKSQILVDENTKIQYFNDIKINTGKFTGLIDFPAGLHYITINSIVYYENFLAGKCYLTPVRWHSKVTTFVKMEEIGNARWNMPIVNELAMNPGESIIIFNGNFPTALRFNYLLLYINDNLAGPIGPISNFPAEITKIKVQNGNQKIEVRYPTGNDTPISINIDANNEIIELIIKNSWPLANLSIDKK